MIAILLTSWSRNSSAATGREASVTVGPGSAGVFVFLMAVPLPRYAGSDTSTGGTAVTVQSAERDLELPREDVLKG